MKAAIEREKSDACISSSEREQARPQVKSEEGLARRPEGESQFAAAVFANR
jgi:hypothetical protein